MGEHLVPRQWPGSHRERKLRRGNGSLGECVIKIESNADVVIARRKGRSMAADIGFEPKDLTRITSAISELARNIIAYAKRGEIVLLSMDQERRHGIAVTGRDDGPGILDVSQAIKTGEGQGTELLITIPRENADVSANYHR